VNKDKGQGVSRRAFVGRVTAGAAGGALAMAFGARAASALSSDDNGADLLGHRTAGGTANAIGSAAEAEALPETAGRLGKITETAPAPWEIVRPLRAGAALVDGWRLEDLSGVVAGACVLTLANEHGRAQRVHVCRNDGAPQGLVYTEGFDLLVMNGGRGDLPTEESFGQSVAAVAHVIAANEGRKAEIDGLLSQAAREERFAAAELR
jgi:hypothetical protein